MDRKLKKAINLKIAQILDTKCSMCEFRLVKNRVSHCKEYCSVFEELQSFSSMLINDENKNRKAAVTKTEKQFKTGRWDKEDEFYLIHHAGLFSYEHLAKKFNRSRKDVYNKVWRLKEAKKITI